MAILHAVHLNCVPTLGHLAGAYVCLAAICLLANAIFRMCDIRSACQLLLVQAAGGC